MKNSFRKLIFFGIIILSFAGFVAAQTEREKGVEFYEKGNYKVAAETLQKTVEADETDGEAWRFLGMAFARIDDKKQARKAFKKADDFREKDLNKNYDIPVEITSKSYPKYTETARRNNVSGTIKLAVEFRHDGQIGFIFPLTQLSDGLTENAAETAKNIKFNPAIRNGKTVTVIKFIEYSYTIY